MPLSFFSFNYDDKFCLPVATHVCPSLAATSKTVKVRRSASPVDLKNDEAVRMSMFPSGKPPLPNELVKIEREDWPGPPSPAAILPEISEYSWFHIYNLYIFSIFMFITSQPLEVFPVFLPKTLM